MRKLLLILIYQTFSQNSGIFLKKKGGFTTCTKTSIYVNRDEGKINKMCSCRLDSYFQMCRINFNSCTLISSRFFVCWKVVQLYNFSAHKKPTGNDCAGIKVNSAHEKPTGNNCAGIKVNSAQLEITVQSTFGAAQFIDFTPGEVSIVFWGLTFLWEFFLWQEQFQKMTLTHFLKEKLLYFSWYYTLIPRCPKNESPYKKMSIYSLQVRNIFLLTSKFQVFLSCFPPPPRAKRRVYHSS